MSLLVISTHPIQYHAPVYRMVQARFNIPVTAIYGSDFSIAGYQDSGFGVKFAWDTDLLSGYNSIFLSRVAEGGAASAEQVSARGLGKAIQQAAPAAIMLIGYSAGFYRQAFRLAWQRGVPLFFRAETTDHALARNLLKRIIRDNALRFFYRRFSKLLYIGRHSLDHYRRLGGTGQQLVFSPYCVDTGPFQAGEEDRERLRKATRDELNISNEQRVLLFSGKLVSRKSPDLLVRSVQNLANDRRDRSVIVFLGDGDLRDSLRQLAVCLPQVEVRFVGFQNQQSLSRFYHAADLLVLPSQVGETWGLVVNEALHHGLPCVVSTMVGCAPDLVVPDATGQVFASGLVPNLSAAIEKAWSLVGRAEVREQCRRQVARYTVEKAAEGIASAYQAVAGK